jgi:peptidoglycan endopeptidase LytF/peptidoglycan endopeptidase LytE
MTTDALMTLNNLTDPDSLFVGSSLQVPVTVAPMGQAQPVVLAAAPTARTQQVAGQATQSAVQVQQTLQAQGYYSPFESTLTAQSVRVIPTAPQNAIQVPLTSSQVAAGAAAPIARMPMGSSTSASASTTAGSSASASLTRLPDFSTPPSLAGAVPASVAIALQYTGAPYQFGGSSPAGFDCSGFVSFVLSRAGKSIPRDIFGQYDAGSHPTSLQPGDLVFFQNTYEYGLSHAGIYVGDGQFIHAIDESRGVGLSSLNDSYWSSKWYGATRVQ